jgi:hypothetical protein
MRLSLANWASGTCVSISLCLPVEWSTDDMVEPLAAVLRNA